MDAHIITYIIDWIYCEIKYENLHSKSMMKCNFSKHNYFVSYKVGVILDR